MEIKRLSLISYTHRKTEKKSTYTWAQLHNHLFVCSFHRCFVDDPSVPVNPVNSLFFEMKVKQDRASDARHKPSVILAIKAHPMNSFTMAIYQERL